MSYILIFLFLTSIFCNVAFGIGPNLYPLRLILPITLLYFSVLFFQKVILLREKLQLNLIVLLSILFFFYSFLQTSVVSYFRFNLLGSHYEMNAVLNYTFLAAFIITIYFIIITKKDLFFKQIKYSILLFYLAYAFYAIYEIISGNHLSTSDLIDAPWWMRHVPTVVYFNSNDFASVFTMMFMFLLSSFDKDKEQKTAFILVIFTIHILIIYYSQSRLALIMSLLFFIYRYPYNIFRLIGLSLITVLFFWIFSNDSSFMQTLDSFVALKDDLRFSERQSTSVRLYLYKYALISPLSNFGLGFGIDYSAEYFRTINDANLHNIINPHSYIMELLINSGVLVVLFYITINAILLVSNWCNKNYDLFFQIIIYNLLLFSSSSSNFLWPIYLFFIVYICRTSYKSTT
ncbi:MAG: hypothetical protein CMP55_00740 [Flavobacteriales bacterium]|nr:hypothetical protein [Flavobacteriales bacterium]